MTNEEAIKAIKANLPPENYSILREALMIAIHALDEEQPSKSCSYYINNKKEPCCTHDCDGCMWYV